MTRGAAPEVEPPGRHAFGLETVELDLPALAAAFSRRLAARGMPVGPERSVALARSLTLTRPLSRRRLYWTMRAALVTDPGQQRAFDATFTEVFGTGRGPTEIAEDARRLAPVREAAPLPPRSQPPLEQAGSEDPWSRSAPAASRSEGEEAASEVPVPMLASEEEVLRTTRFDALDAHELAQLYTLMARLELTTPRRLSRRRRRARHGAHVDLRRTLRASLRTGGEPLSLSRRRRRVERRRIVLLCDISGSMEPYARAYLQFLACAVGGRGRVDAHEAFLFATRLTRVTRALRAGRPERALAAAAATAPDWSSGTRIGDALRAFNDGYGRRGMARGAVVVIFSDGWERGDPSLVGRELARLARLAYRIVWVNPRVSASGFSPRAGGMAAALPYCDALVSGHSLAALEEVAEAIGADRRRDGDPDTRWRPPAVPAEAPEDEWASASAWSGALPGSSVAMPSGNRPARGRTTPGVTR